MNIKNNPALLTHLAQSRALGLLKPHTLARLESIADQQPSVRAQLLLWQHHFSHLTQLQGSAVAPPNVWKRIALSIEPDIQPSVPLRATQPKKINWFGWLSASVATAGIALSIGLAWQKQRLEKALAESNRQAVRYVAVLKDPQAKETLLVTLDRATQQWKVKRLDAFREAPDRSLQLWALPQNGQPKSIGVLDTSDQVRLQAVLNQFQSVPGLAVSLEPKGGVPEAGGPTGPVLFQGRLLETPA
jgi:anti-sigma-K factor RskA